MGNRITLDELKSYLWQSAVLLRINIDAGAYKQYIFPLMFFKRICDVYDEKAKQYLEKYGEDIGGARDFPSAASLAAAGEDELFALRTGFRAKYIYAAAKAVSDDASLLEKIASAKDYADAERLLVALKGVGPKVAACTLLFGFERYDAFPVDVWIKKVLERRFSPKFDYHALGAAAGIAQQYLFYFERYLGGEA